MLIFYAYLASCGIAKTSISCMCVWVCVCVPWTFPHEAEVFTNESILLYF